MAVAKCLNKKCSVWYNGDCGNPMIIKENCDMFSDIKINSTKQEDKKRLNYRNSLIKRCK